MTRHLRIFASILLALYGVFVLVVTLWPQRVDKPIDHQLRTAINSAHDAGAPRHLGYSLVQNVSNGLLFLPLGVLLAIVLTTSRWWLAPTISAVLSIGIELTQHFFLPNRLGTVTDVISNTAGALVGALAIVAYRAIRTRSSDGRSALNSTGQDLSRRE
jgi:glycopeptide antibiotics resistance protein